MYEFLRPDRLLRLVFDALQTVGRHSFVVEMIEFLMSEIPLRSELRAELTDLAIQIVEGNIPPAERGPAVQRMLARAGRS